MYLFFLLFVFILCSFSQIFAQQQLIQFTGVVVTSDSLKPIPFAHIVINSNKGTIADFNGFFSFVARPKDIIVFSAVGFKKTYYVVPDTLTKEYYTMFHVLHRDTIYLPETVIYPWPSPEQFRMAFINLKIPEDDYDRAIKNISLMAQKEQHLYAPMDASTSYKYYIQNVIQKYYTIGQLPVNNLLNPFAWAAFIKAWHNGEFRKPAQNYWNNFPIDN